MARPAQILPFILFLAAVAVLVVVVYPMWADAEEIEPVDAAPGMEFPMAVTVAPVHRGRVVETVDLVGDVISARVAMLAFERSGRVTEVNADLGQEIQSDSVLAKLDDSVLDERISVSEARKNAAVHEKKLADVEAERGREMGDRVLPKADQDRRNADAEVAAARVDEQDAELRQLRAELAQGTLKAPFTGVVTARNITLGSHAMAGSMAFELVDLANREVHFEIPPQVVPMISTGATIELRVDELPDEVWQGTLSRIVAAADPGTRTFKGIVQLHDIDSARRLLPGMFVRGGLELRAVDNALIVPADALLRTSFGEQVVVARVKGETQGEGGMPPEMRAEFVAVEVLARSDSELAVRAVGGQIASGEKVVVTGVDNVYPQALLMPVGGPPPGAPGAEGQGHGDSPGGDSPPQE